MAKRSRTFKRTFTESFRRVKDQDDRFANSLANSIITSSPVLIFDVQHFLNIIGTVYRTHVRREGGGPQYTGRQKQVIAVCQYLEQRGEVCRLSRDEDGNPSVEFFSDPGRKRNYCDSLCLLNGLERLGSDEEEDEEEGEGANYVDDHAQAINVGGEIDLDMPEDDGDSLTDSAKEG